MCLSWLCPWSCVFFLCFFNQPPWQKKNRLFQSFEKNRANLAKQFNMLRIWSKLRKSGAYRGHCNTYSSIVLKSARDTMVPGVRRGGLAGQSWGHWHCCCLGTRLIRGLVGEIEHNSLALKRCTNKETSFSHNGKKWDVINWIFLGQRPALNPYLSNIEYKYTAFWRQLIQVKPFYMQKKI